MMERNDTIAICAEHRGSGGPCPWCRIARLTRERDDARGALRDCVLRLTSHGVNAHDETCTCRKVSVVWPCSCGLDAVVGRAMDLLAAGREE